MPLEDLERQARDEGRPWPPPFPGGPERPDPLAPPAGYGVKPEDAVKAGLEAGLSVCSMIMGNSQNCALPVTLIIWIGCTKGEHAGPQAYCRVHGAMITRMRALTCGQCDERGHRDVPVKILKIDRLEDEQPGPEKAALEGIFGTEGDDNDASEDL